jgi:hypothetical protein
MFEKSTAKLAEPISTGSAIAVSIAKFPPRSFNSLSMLVFSECEVCIMSPELVAPLMQSLLRRIC